MKLNRPIRMLRAPLLFCALAAALAAWSAPGHRTIARLAIERLPSTAPDWIRGEAGAQMAAYGANEPDRYRSVKFPAMSHENNADHYLDAELLKDHGLTLRSLPRLRYQFVEVLVRTTPAAAPTPTNADGQAIATITPTFSPEGVGMLPYAIMEHYAKLVSSMNTARIIEAINDPKMANLLEQARANVRFEMGQLAHFVGDAGQPLHMTIHHHGWVGDNPDGFTTDKKFHSYIDGDIVEHHKLNVEAMHAFATPSPELTSDSVWDATIGLMERSFAALRPLYEMEKSGELRGEKGKSLIAARLGDSAATLGAMYASAWRESQPTQKQIEDFKKFDSTDVELTWTASPTRADE